MKNFVTLILLSITSASFGQYYYTDVVGTNQTNQLYKLIRSQGLKKINATSYEQGNEASKDFVLEQMIVNDGQQIVTHSASVGNTPSNFVSTYENNKLIRTYDSSNTAINDVYYKYNGQGRLLLINSTSKDFDGTFVTHEIHQWSYNDKGQPSKMLKIKNTKDTTEILFYYDENETLAEEVWKKNNRAVETYYYYHNDKKQLTDIVRYNRKARQMLPDYMFEYDANGRIAQLTQTQARSANYLVFKYAYNSLGFKERELVYNKQKELLGKIEYSYK